MLLSDPQARFFYFCFFCVCGLLFYSTYQFLFCVVLLPLESAASCSQIDAAVAASERWRGSVSASLSVRASILLGSTVQASGRLPIPYRRRSLSTTGIRSGRRLLFRLEFDWTHIRFSSPPVTTNDSGRRTKPGSRRRVHCQDRTGLDWLAACPLYLEAWRQAFYLVV